MMGLKHFRRHWRKLYGASLVLGAASYFWYRRADLLAGDPSVIDLMVGFGVGALLLSPLFREVSFGGVSVKKEIERVREEVLGRISELHATVTSRVAVSSTVNVQNLVHEEVRRSQMEAVGMLAELDRGILEAWEWEGSSVPHTRRDLAVRKLQLLNERFDEVRDRLRTAAPADGAQYAWVLRDLYWELLRATRKFAGSAGTEYAKTRGRVVEAMDELARLGRSERGDEEGSKM